MTEEPDFKEHADEKARRARQERRARYVVWQETADDRAAAAAERAVASAAENSANPNDFDNPRIIELHDRRMAERRAQQEADAAITDWITAAEATRKALPVLFGDRFPGFGNEHDKMVLDEGPSHPDWNQVAQLQKKLTAQIDWCLRVWLPKRGLIERNGLVRESRLDAVLTEYAKYPSRKDAPAEPLTGRETALDVVDNSDESGKGTHAPTSVRTTKEQRAERAAGEWLAKGQPGPKPATRERTKHLMLKLLRAGRDLKNEKLTALAKELKVSRDTARRALSEALSEFLAAETPTNFDTE